MNICFLVARRCHARLSGSFLEHYSLVSLASDAPNSCRCLPRSLKPWGDACARAEPQQESRRSKLCIVFHGCLESRSVEFAMAAEIASISSLTGLRRDVAAPPPTPRLERIVPGTPGMVRAGCLAHVRRKFNHAPKLDPKDREAAGRPAADGQAVGRKNAFLTLAALLLIGGSLMADSYRVHYSIRGSGRDVTVQAESSAEARRTVMEMFPGAVVTGVNGVRRPCTIL